jgi:TonB family protein
VRSATRVQSALEICFRTPPPYPASALRDGHEGRSVVGFRISAYNFLQDVTLASSSGHESLDQAALAHLERCRAAALQRDNPFPPEGRYQLPVNWRIEP